MTHITGIFNSATDANAAAQRLLEQGFPRENISVQLNDMKPAVVVKAQSDTFKAVRLALRGEHEIIEAA